MAEQRNWLGLGQLIPTLLRTHDGRAVGYQQVLKLVHTGEVPADFVDGRWRVRDENLDAIAEKLGMTPKTRVAA